MDLEDRFWAKVTVRDGCWSWTGAKVQGYGVLAAGSRDVGQIRAHRLSYIMHKGEIPAGMMVLHKCDNPECTNPDHLEIGSGADNMRHVSERKRNPSSQKTHCKHGHEFTPENTIRRGGSRRCRECKNASERRSRANKVNSGLWVSSRKPKTHCPHGHEYTPETTYWNPSGYKECSLCRRNRVNALRARRKQTQP